ncbi:hypothetical protein JM16_002323 [Phytophthora kernoviae]|uniref:Major facilitator superfamily (MFS) profile domain-containing protein n=1 Tax=Phytophthora kernoviae TaxID=325452 RepID=A0A8T0M4S3_9STRA|nr:hypothetical protein JM16_002323 [Phytophthora kernoviae]
MTTPGSPLAKSWYDDLLWETKLMYALSSAGGSAMFNFLTVYYQHTAGFSKVQIGVLQTLPSLAAIVAPPFWGAIADRIRDQRFVHVFCIVSGSFLWFILQYFAWSYEWTIVVIVLAQFQRSPASSLLDHAVLNMLAKVGGEYGKQRLFGAVGFGIGAYVTGLAVAVGGIYWAFGMSFTLCMSSLLVLRLIPPVRYGDDDGYTVLEPGEGKPKADPVSTPSFLENIRIVVKELDVLVLLGVVFLMGLMYGVLSSFLTLNLYNLSGGDAKIVGVAIICETASELPAFFFSHQVIKKMGTVNVLLMSIAGYALRISYYAVMTDAWSAIPFEFLHGITFGLAWAAVTQYVYSATPKGCEGTVMGVLNAIQNGLARALGTLVGGFFYEDYGARIIPTASSQSAGCHKLLWEPKLLYALNSAWGSTIGNYLAVYYQHAAGFSKMQIALLQTLPSIASILGPPFWGAVADHLRNQRVVHVFCIVSGTLLQFATKYFYWSLGWTVIMVLLGQLQGGPASSLLDHTVLNLISKEGGEYGKQRLFGAVGWGLGTYLTGVVVSVGGIFWSFNLCLIMGFSTLLVLRLIPPVKYGEEYIALETDDGKEIGCSEHVPSFLETVRLISQKLDVLVLLGAVFIMGNMHGVFTSFLQLNLYNMSGDNAHIIGVAIMCETSSELPAFFFADKIIKKIGTVNVLLVSLVGYSLRLSCYTLMSNAWSAIPFEFLHGVTFGLTWAACTEYVFSAAPRGCEGTVMGVLSAVQNGLARASGTLIGGYFYENYDARMMWIVTGLGVPFSLAIVALFAYLKEEEEIAAPNEELLQERAALFSPHSGDPQGLKSPRQLTYDSI